MNKAGVIFIIIAAFFILMTEDLLAFTFEFHKDKPGVNAFALKYLRFTVDGENIITRLPMTFYVISHFPDDIPVLVARVGKIDKTSGLSPYLEKIPGGGSAKSIKGPHGEKITYNPNRPPGKRLLSSYALWDGWIFIGNKKETLHNLLKLFKSPSDITKIDKSVPPSIKEWKVAGIRFWGDNSNDHLYNLFKAQEKRILIPLIKDPRKIQYIAGAFTLTESREIEGSLIVRPVNQQARKDLEGDLRFIGETIRRRLIVIKTSYRGKVYSKDSYILYEGYIGNYMAAQGQIVQVER